MSYYSTIANFNMLEGTRSSVLGPGEKILGAGELKCSNVWATVRAVAQTMVEAGSFLCFVALLGPMLSRRSSCNRGRQTLHRLPEERRNPSYPSRPEPLQTFVRQGRCLLFRMPRGGRGVAMAACGSLCVAGRHRIFRMKGGKVRESSGVVWSHFV